MYDWDAKGVGLSPKKLAACPPPGLGETGTGGGAAPGTGTVPMVVPYPSRPVPAPPLNWLYNP